jgi:hypothetical protein
VNILVIAHFQNDGSPYVSYVHDQVLAYKKAGHNVCVISPVVCFKKEAEVYKGVTERNIDNINIYYPRYISLSNYGIYGMNVILGYLGIKKQLAKVINEFKPDVIHTHTILFDGAIGAKLKARYNIPVIITTHGSDTSKAIEDGKAEYVIKICKKVNTVVAVSSKLKKLLNNADSSLNPYVVCNGFNSQFCTEKPKERHSIIQVSNLIKQKNVDITIKAVAELKKEYEDVRLIIVGEGPEKKNLLELCNRLNLLDVVTFTGQISNKEVLNLMAETEVFVMPSIKEGLGIVYLEAMASGCVTIGTKGEGIEDIIVNGNNGFLIEKIDSKNIANYIKECFESKEYESRITEAGKDTARRLTWDNNVKKYIDILSKL